MSLVKVAVKRYSKIRKNKIFNIVRKIRMQFHIHKKSVHIHHAGAQARIGQDTEVRLFHGLAVTLEAGKPVSPRLMLKWRKSGSSTLTRADVPSRSAGAPHSFMAKLFPYRRWQAWDRLSGIHGSGPLTLGQDHFVNHLQPTYPFDKPLILYMKPVLSNIYLSNVIYSFYMWENRLGGITFTQLPPTIFGRRGRGNLTYWPPDTEIYWKIPIPPIWKK